MCIYEFYYDQDEVASVADAIHEEVPAQCYVHYFPKTPGGFKDTTESSLRGLVPKVDQR